MDRQLTQAETQAFANKSIVSRQVELHYQRIDVLKSLAIRRRQLADIGAEVASLEAEIACIDREYAELSKAAIIRKPGNGVTQ